MDQATWNVILSGLAYAAITGILNLLIAERSRVDAWAESKPRLAAVLKVLRGIGFDPWHLVAAASLFFSKKLPSPKQPHARIIPPGTGIFLLAFAVGSAVGLLTSCSPPKPAEMPPGCHETDAAAVATDCAAKAAKCVADGGSEEACGSICDKRADERAEQCR